MTAGLTGTFAEIADETLYSRNAFRVTGLATTAGARAVRDRRKRAAVAADAGVDGPGAADPGALATAFDAITDPRRRIAHELFWLWGPDTSGCGCDEEVHDLHDRAIHAHSEAIDQAVAGRSDPDTWALAASSWLRLVRDPRTWAHLAARVTALDDRRLGDDVVEHLRTSTPRLLVAANVQTALNGVGDERSLVLTGPGWGADRALVENVVRDVTSPKAAPLLALLAEAQVAVTDGGAEEAGLEVQERVVPVLRRLAAVAPPARYRHTQDLADQAAMVLNNAALAMVDAEGAGEVAPDADEQRVLEFLRTAESLGPSGETRTTIASNADQIGRTARANRLLRRYGLRVATTSVDDLIERINKARAAGYQRRALDLVDALLELIPSDDPGRVTVLRVRSEIVGAGGGPQRSRDGGGDAPARDAYGMTPLQAWSPLLALPVVGLALLAGSVFSSGLAALVVAVVGVAAVLAVRFGYLPYDHGAPRLPRRRWQVTPGRFLAFLLVLAIPLTFTIGLFRASALEGDMSVEAAWIVGSLIGIVQAAFVGVLILRGDP